MVINDSVIIYIDLGWVSVGGQFPQISGRIAWGTAETLRLRRISARGNWVEKLVFCVVFIYLFIYYLLIYYLFIYLLFIYFKGAVYHVMHQFYSLALWGWGMVVWGSNFF